MYLSLCSHKRVGAQDVLFSRGIETHAMLDPRRENAKTYVYITYISASKLLLRARIMEPFGMDSDWNYSVFP